MNYKFIKCSNIINKITSKDNLFLGDYTVDPYQNCEFGCKYCDSTYDSTIYIKSNICELLDAELQNLKKGCIIVGSVHDPYQKIEEKEKITRNVLKTIKKHGFSCHILTKSTLVIRDMDLIADIDDSVVTISMISSDKHISDVFEKNAPSPKNRFETVEKLSKQGVKTGIAIMPVLPFLVEENLQDVIKTADKYKAQYVLHKHLELKGDQKNIFIDILKNFYPELVEKYVNLYKDSYMPDEKYIVELKNKIEKLSKQYNIKNRI